MQGRILDQTLEINVIYTYQLRRKGDSKRKFHNRDESTPTTDITPFRRINT